MTWGEIFGIAILIMAMLIGFNYLEKTRNECKLKAIENHLSIDDAKKLCN